VVRKHLNWEISDPFEIYGRIHGNFENSFILESSTGPEELAKHTFIGFDPVTTLQFKDGVFKENEKVIKRTPNPLETLINLEKEFEGIPAPPRLVTSVGSSGISATILSGTSRICPLGTLTPLSRI